MPFKDFCLFFCGIFMGPFPSLALLVALSLKEQPDGFVFG